MTSCTRESSVHFDKTWLSFRFMFVFLFTAPTPSRSTTTHKCLPFSPASPPTLLTWSGCGVKGVTVLTARAGYRYYTFQEYRIISLHFLRNDQAGRSLLLYCNKFAGSISRWKFITLRVQYTTLDYSSQPASTRPTCLLSRTQLLVYFKTLSYLSHCRIHSNASV
jgi:hypothetical protein